MPHGLDLVFVFIGFAVLVASLSVHEAAHAWTADKLGDPTARMLGRVSLNPARHVDPVGTVLFPLIALLTRLPLIGWAKPVPVNTRNFRNPRRDYVFVAAAGLQTAASAKRVSVVTAVSPGALIDMLFVASENLRMLRRLARGSRSSSASATPGSWK